MVSKRTHIRITVPSGIKNHILVIEPQSLKRGLLWTIRYIGRSDVTVFYGHDTIAMLWVKHGIYW